MSDDLQYHIEDGLTRAIQNFLRFALICEAQIINTDNAETSFTVDVQLLSDGKPQYLGVPLKVLQNSQASFIEIPNVNSYCLIGFRDGKKDRPQVLFVDSVLKILVNCGSFIFNNGTYGGLIKLIDPNDSNAGILARLNKIESDINNLKTVFETWVPVPSDGGAALKTGAALWFGNDLVPTERTDLEDTAVTH